MTKGRRPVVANLEIDAISVKGEAFVILLEAGAVGRPPPQVFSR